MATLATINGEAFAVAGLRFWGRRYIEDDMDRFSIIAQDAEGAIEVWTQVGPLTDVGGVEVHSAKARLSPEPDDDHCDIVGGDCYGAATSWQAWPEQFTPLVAAGDSAGVLRLLADWHESHFGPVAA